MNRLMTWLKSMRIDRIVTVFLSAIVLFVTTACSNGVSAKTVDQLKTADKVRQEVPSGAVTSPYKGGMNDYSDVDPRFNESGAQTKAKGLVDNAERNLDKSIDSPEQYVENYRQGAPLNERVQRIGENLGNAAKNVTGEASKGTQENARNVKNVAKDAASDAKQAAGTAKSNVDQAANSVQRNVNKAADKLD